VKWSQRFRTTESAAPGQIGGHRPVLLTDHRDFMLARLAAEADVTLRGLRAELLERLDLGEAARASGPSSMVQASNWLRGQWTFP